MINASDELEEDELAGFNADTQVRATSLIAERDVL